MELNPFGTTGLVLVALTMALTQELKEALRLEGAPARRLSLLVGALLGALLGFMGLRTSAATLFPDVPPVAAAVVIGALLGMTGSGLYKMITWLQDRGVNLRAQKDAQLRRDLPPEIHVALPPALIPGGPAPTVPGPTEGMGAEIEDLDPVMPDIPALPPGAIRGLLSPPPARVERHTHPAFAQRPTSTVEDVLQATGQTPLVHTGNGPYRG